MSDCFDFLGSLSFVVWISVSDDEVTAAAYVETSILSSFLVPKSLGRRFHRMFTSLSSTKMMNFYLLRSPLYCIRQVAKDRRLWCAHLGSGFVYCVHANADLLNKYSSFQHYCHIMPTSKGASEWLFRPEKTVRAYLWWEMRTQCQEYTTHISAILLQLEDSQQCSVFQDACFRWQ